MGFPKFNRATWSPADEAVAVSTAVADVTLDPPSRALYVGTGGDIKVDMATAGTGIVFPAVPSGFILPVQVVKVYKTGTTASGIVSIY